MTNAVTPTCFSVFFGENLRTVRNPLPFWATYRHGVCRRLQWACRHGVGAGVFLNVPRFCRGNAALGKGVPFARVHLLRGSKPPGSNSMGTLVRLVLLLCPQTKRTCRVCGSVYSEWRIWVKSRTRRQYLPGLAYYEHIGREASLVPTILSWGIVAHRCDIPSDSRRMGNF